MVKVIERLQVEADVQGGIILDMWSDERSVDRRFDGCQKLPFSFWFRASWRHRGIWASHGQARRQLAVARMEESARTRELT